MRLASPQLRRTTALLVPLSHAGEKESRQYETCSAHHQMKVVYGSLSKLSFAVSTTFI